MRAAPMLGLFVASLSFAAVAEPPRSLEVAPTTLELKAGEAGLLYIANHSAAPAIVQIDIYDWKQSGNEDHLLLSDTAFVSPPLTTIAPGERQIVRILADPKPSGSESTYRVRVSELLDPATKANGVQVLLQFSIPAFVEGFGGAETLGWTAVAKGNTLELTAQNGGDKTAKLGGLTVSSGGTPVDVALDRVAYVLPNASHVWTVDAPSISQATRVRVTGTDERSGKSISADIAVAR